MSQESMCEDVIDIYTVTAASGATPWQIGTTPTYANVSCMVNERSSDKRFEMMGFILRGTHGVLIPNSTSYNINENANRIIFLGKTLRIMGIVTFRRLHSTAPFFILDCEELKGQI